MKSSQFGSVIVSLLLIPIHGRVDVSPCGQLQLDHDGLMTESHPTHHWPWHAAIYHRKGGIDTSTGYKCGGTMINSDSIITAGHCVINRNGKAMAKEQISVSLGRRNLASNETGTEWLEVARIILHENYRSMDYSNDIAILKLTNKVEYNKFVQPICMWNSSRTDLSEVVGKYGTVVGWGQTHEAEQSNELLQASLPVISTFDCLESNRNFVGSYLSDTNFCAGLRNGTSVCRGDSGGSITFPESGIYYIRGIVSVGPVKMYNTTAFMCNAMRYAIFTDVAKYLPWIAEQSEIVVRCTWNNGECQIRLDLDRPREVSQIIFDEIPNASVNVLRIIGKFTSIPNISDAAKKFVNLDNLKMTGNGLKVVTRVQLTAFKRILKVDLSVNEISELEADTFSDLKNVTELYLSGNELKELDGDIFEELHHLDILNLNENQLEVLPPNIFRNNRKLREIFVGSNKMNAIHGDVFSEVDHLETVWLDDNQLEVLPSNIFRNNRKLREIFLAKNRLKEINGDTFNELFGLQLLALFDNRIESLPANIFRNNKKLRHISFDDNELKEIHSDLVKELNHLESISVNYNKLEMLPANLFRDNKKLQVISFHHNKLTEIHGDTLKELHDLENISLERNQLAVLHPNFFRDNQKLRNINVGFNKLTEIHVDTFRGLKHLEILGLNNNELEVLPRGLFRDNQQLRAVNFNHNELKKIEADFDHLPLLVDLGLVANVCINEYCHSRSHCNTSSLFDMNENIKKKCSS